jgi:hypothetical protein
MGDYIVAVARQRPANNNTTVFSAGSAKQQLNSNRGTVFSVRSVRCYRQDKWSNGLAAVREITNQESPCWRGPTAIYWNGLVSHSVAGHSPVIRE